MSMEEPMESQPVTPEAAKTEVNGEMPPVDVDITPPTGILDRVIEGTIGRALGRASARNVFGDPITQGERTVIPVARVSIGYGFGAGSGRSNDEEESPTGSGGGGGGRVKETPIGYIEMTPGEVKFVPILDRSALLSSLVPLAFLGLFFALPRLLRRRS